MVLISSLPAALSMRTLWLGKEEEEREPIAIYSHTTNYHPHLNYQGLSRAPVLPWSSEIHAPSLRAYDSNNTALDR